MTFPFLPWEEGGPNCPAVRRKKLLWFPEHMASQIAQHKPSTVEWAELASHALQGDEIVMASAEEKLSACGSHIWACWLVSALEAFFWWFLSLIPVGEWKAARCAYLEEGTCTLRAWLVRMAWEGWWGILLANIKDLRNFQHAWWCWSCYRALCTVLKH